MRPTTMLHSLTQTDCAGLGCDERVSGAAEVHIEGISGLSAYIKKVRTWTPFWETQTSHGPADKLTVPFFNPQTCSCLSRCNSRSLLSGLPFSSIAQVPSMLHTVLQSDKKEIGLICSSSFRCIAKLSIKYRDFQCAPCTPTCPASCALNI